jgi:hypothetical protein
VNTYLNSGLIEWQRSDRGLPRAGQQQSQYLGVKKTGDTGAVQPDQEVTCPQTSLPRRTSFAHSLPIERLLIYILQLNYNKMIL